MPESILPSFVEFGVLGDPEPLFAEDVASVDANESSFTLRPLGKDLLFNFLTGEFELNDGGGIRVCEEDQALKQWITIALGTPRGDYIIYPSTFGSDLGDLAQANLPEAAIAAELPNAITDAVMAHDRISSIASVQSTVDDNDVLNISFQAILDDDAVLAYQIAATLG